MQSIIFTQYSGQRLFAREVGLLTTKKVVQKSPSAEKRLGLKKGVEYFLEIFLMFIIIFKHALTCTRNFQKQYLEPKCRFQIIINT